MRCVSQQDTCGLHWISPATSGPLEMIHCGPRRLLFGGDTFKCGCAMLGTFVHPKHGPSVPCKASWSEMYPMPLHADIAISTFFIHLMCLVHLHNLGMPSKDMFVRQTNELKFICNNHIWLWTMLWNQIWICASGFEVNDEFVPQC